MITKMTKYSFIVYHQELNSFLETLQSLGMVDIVRNNKPIDQKSGEMFDQIKRYKAALKRLAHFTPSIDAAPSHPISEAELLTTVESSLTLLDANKQELDSLNRDLESALPWGEIHSQDLSKIETLSLTVHFYVCSVKRFEDEWTQKYAIHELNRDNDRVYFALIANKDEETDFPLQEVRIPQFSISEYRQKIAELESYKTTLESLLQYLASKTDILQSQLNKTIALSDLYLAGKSSVKEADDTLAENVEFEVEDLEKVVEAGYPDVRKTLQLLEAGSKSGKLQIQGEGAVADWKLQLLPLLETGDLKAARTLVCTSATKEELQDVYRFLYDNVHRVKKFAGKEDQAVILIAQYQYQHMFVADVEIQVAALFIELGAL
jgi:V/A-type H+-transporting ATPase subunit I